TVEDLGERFGDDGANAPAVESLRRVLARRSGSEVAVRQQDRRALVLTLVERMRLPGARRGEPIVLEHVIAEAVERDLLQEGRGHDALGVDVLAAQRQRAPVDDVYLLGPHQRPPAGTASSISRTSVTLPVIAAAATIAGLMSSVRPVGLPCRPL